MITFSNDFYNAEVNQNGKLIVKSIYNELIINDLKYHATTGVTASVVESIPAGATKVVVDESHVDRLSVGDNISIHTGAINNSHMSDFTIVDIVDNTVHLSNGFSGSWENAQYASRTIVKETSKIEGLDNVTVNELDFDNGKQVNIEGATPVSEVKIIITFHENSHEIEFETEVEYTTDVKVFNEKLDIVFADRPSEIYKPNRKVDKEIKQNHYWLDKQGAKFGKGSKSTYIYHVPNVSSLEVFPDDKKLTINLDDMHDHHYRFVKPAQGDRVFIDRHASEFKNGDKRLNDFKILVGEELKTARLMISPNGYLATYIFTEHADGATLDSHRATVFGDSSVTDIEDAVGGFAKYNIPITKSVFYFKRRTNAVSIIEHEDSQEYFDFLKQLDAVGFDICLHTGADGNTIRPELEEAIPFMKEQFGSNVWIDHQPDLNREAISADGLIPPEELGLELNESSYAKDLWKGHDTKYFWTFSSEDNRIFGNDIDLLRPHDSESVRTPLYWKHPTVTDDFYTWAATSLSSHRNTADWWNELLSKTNLDKLVGNWGISINHGYFAYLLESGILNQESSNIVLKDEFNNALERMSDYRDDGKINVATVKEIMEYWSSLENVDIDFKDDGISVTNNNDKNIIGLSLAVNVVEIDSEIEFKAKKANGSKVIWFNLGASETAIFNFIDIEKDELSKEEMLMFLNRKQTNYMSV